MTDPRKATIPTPDFSLHPSPTPGYRNTAAQPDHAPPGFKPRPGEGQAQARRRVIDQVGGIAAANGQKPARNS